LRGNNDSRMYIARLPPLDFSILSFYGTTCASLSVSYILLTLCFGTSHLLLPRVSIVEHSFWQKEEITCIRLYVTFICTPFSSFRPTLAVQSDSCVFRSTSPLGVWVADLHSFILWSLFSSVDCCSNHVEMSLLLRFYFMYVDRILRRKRGDCHGMTGISLNDKRFFSYLSGQFKRRHKWNDNVLYVYEFNPFYKILTHHVLHDCCLKIYDKNLPTYAIITFPFYISSLNRFPSHTQSFFVH